MEIFIDTANVEDIKKFLPWNIISGTTTNQKIFSCEKGINFKDRVHEILSVIDGPLSIEVTKTDEGAEALVAEAKEYSSWSPKNIVIKIPMFGDGKGLVLASMRTPGNGDGLPARLFCKGRRARVRDPNLNGAQALLTQALAMRPDLVAGRLAA